MEKPSNRAGEGVAPLPISSLDPDAGTPQQNASIEGIITLIWPYSSATQTIAFLLAEPGVRLRTREKAQVRVQFASHAARQVASAKAGIGDRIVVSLNGAVWVHENVASSTPGRSVDGELRFTRKVALEAFGDRQAFGNNNRPFASIDIDEQGSTPSTSPQPGSNSHEPAAPTQLAFKTPQRPPASGVWSFPVVFGSSPHSGLYSSPDVDFFHDEDGSIPGKGRKRTKFARKSNEWRFDGTNEALQLLDDQREALTPSKGLEDATDLPLDETQSQGASSMASSDVGDEPVDVELSVQEILPDDGVADSAPMTQSSTHLLDLSINQEVPPLIDKQAVPHVQIDLTETTIDSQFPQRRPQAPPSPRLEPVGNPSLPVVSPLESHPVEASFNQLLLLKDGEESQSKEESARAPEAAVATPDFGLDGSHLSKVVQAQGVEGSVMTSQDLPSDLVNFGANPIKRREPEAQAQDRLDAHTSIVSHIGASLEKKRATTSAVKAHVADDSRQPPDAGDSYPLDHDIETEPHRNAAVAENGPGERMNVEGSPSPQNNETRQADLEDDPHPQAGHDGGNIAESQVLNASQNLFDEFLVSSPGLVQTLAEEETALSRIQKAVDTPQDSQEPLRTGDESSHRMQGENQTLENGLPLTPEKTVSNLSEKEPVVEQNAASAKTAMTETQLKPLSEHNFAETELVLDSPRKRKPSRKVREQSQDDVVHPLPSPRTVRKPVMPRVNEVPAPVSPWFSSRRSSRRASDTMRLPQDHEGVHQLAKEDQRGVSEASDVRSNNSTVTREAMEQNEKSHSSHPQLIRDRITRKSTRSKTTEVTFLARPDQGFRTPLSYYAPLSSLESYLTSSASSSQGAALIDVFAIVTSPSSKPLRAKTGPKDYSNLLHITDASLVGKPVHVQCFRPFQESLPQADIGDVILLREFVVKFRKDGCFLLSADSSSWHVWRFKSRDDGGDEMDGNSTSPEPREEANGPPVENGKEEQQHARKLRAWWSHTRDGQQRK